MLQVETIDGVRCIVNVNIVLWFEENECGCRIHFHGGLTLDIKETVEQLSSWFSGKSTKGKKR